MHTNYSFTATEVIGYTTEMSAFQKAPFSVIRSGYYDWFTGGLVYQGSYGYYWFSLAYSSTHSYRLYFAATGYMLQDGSYDKITGFPVRCVVR